MGVFNEFGRQVEKFKQTMQTTADEDDDYHCKACDWQFHDHQDECPKCGAAEIESTNIED